MSSKIRKRPRVAVNKSYQLLDRFTRIPVAPDGNCFYAATGFFCGLNALEMRELIMKYFLYKKAAYAIFFESEEEFINAVKVNCCARVWNSELCDIAPHATAQILRRDIIIHNYDGNTVTQVHTPVENNEALHPPLNLLRSNDHYEILLDNDKTPNKNIFHLPDVSAFSIIDLTFEDDEEPNDYSYNDVCIIRF